MPVHPLQYTPGMMAKLEAAKNEPKPKKEKSKKKKKVRIILQDSDSEDEFNQGLIKSVPKSFRTKLTNKQKHRLKSKITLADMIPHMMDKPIPKLMPAHHNDEKKSRAISEKRTKAKIILVEERDPETGVVTSYFVEKAKRNKLSRMKELINAEKERLKEKADLFIGAQREYIDHETDCSEY